MKILCKSCGSEIPARNINLMKRLCVCEKCNEVFPIADFLADQSGPIDRIPKPSYSKIESIVDGNSIGLILPKGGLTGMSWFFLFFAAFWNAITWVFVFAAAKVGDLSILLFMIPFVLVGVVTAGIFVYSLIGEFSMMMDHQRCVAIWALAGFQYKRSCNTSDIIDIVDAVIYTKNYEPVYGIAIKHEPKKTIKFGSSMTEDERKWCIGELRFFWGQVVEQQAR